MQNKPLIMWEKWQDPILNNIIEPMSTQDNDIEEQDEYSPYNDIEETRNYTFRYPIIMTPFGMLPYTEKTSCDKTFNFWTGHTNFTITKSIADILEKHSGVETLDVFTRYRFRIGIGKAFEDSLIMRSINTSVYEHIHEQS